ncbi:MAG: ABC transporter permease [Patescibacteria group bacterium]
MKTIYILWLRQIKRFFRSKSRIIGSLGQPLLFLVALGFGLGPVYQKAGEGDYLQFLAPGIIAMAILFMSIFTGMEVIWDKQFGFLKETLVAPVPRYQIMLGRTLGGATVAIFQGAIIFALTLALGFRPENWALMPLSLVFIVLIAFIFASLGTAIASLMKDMHGFQLIMNFLVMPIFFLSGAIFPLEGLPKALEIAVKIDPMSYGVDGLRGSLAGLSHLGLGLDLALLSILSLLFLILGSYFFSKIEV